MPNNPKEYSKAEHIELSRLYMEGLPVKSISLKMNRSTQSLYKKIEKLDLRKRREEVLAVAKNSVQAPEGKELAVIGKDVDAYQQVLSGEAANAISTAFSMARSAESVGELNTALSAAQKADHLYRKANGLGESSGVGAGAGGGGTYNFYINAQGQSPLKKAEPVVDV